MAELPCCPPPYHVEHQSRQESEPPVGQQWGPWAGMTSLFVVSKYMAPTKLMLMIDPILALRLPPCGSCTAHLCSMRTPLRMRVCVCVSSAVKPIRARHAGSRRSSRGRMVVAVARTLAAGVALALATRARGFVAPAAVTTMSGARAARPCSSRWPCSRTHSSVQQQQQGVAFAPTSQFLGCASRGRRRIAAQGCASSAGCTAAAGAVSTSPTMGLRVLAPGGGRRLAFAAMANAAAFTAVGGTVCSVKIRDVAPCACNGLLLFRGI